MHTTQAVSDLWLDFKDSSSHSELLPRVLHLKGAQGLKSKSMRRLQTHRSDVSRERGKFVSDSVTPQSAAQASLSLTISPSLRKLMSIDSAMPSNHLILCHSLLLLPSIFPRVRVFSNESALCITEVLFYC